MFIKYSWAQTQKPFASKLKYKEKLPLFTLKKQLKRTFSQKRKQLFELIQNDHTFVVLHFSSNLRLDFPIYCRIHSSSSYEKSEKLVICSYKKITILED